MRRREKPRKIKKTQERKARKNIQQEQEVRKRKADDGRGREIKRRERAREKKGDC